MTALRINHVSIPALDLEESAAFYEEIFGMEKIPSANFTAPTIWMRLGDQQLHLFLREGTPSRYQHLAIEVADFESLYWTAKQRGAVDAETLNASIRSHPTGWVQMYLRDPAGNLVEVDWPDVTTLSEDLVADITPLEDVVPQTGAAAAATIFLQPRVGRT
jgi:YD repeat-containing protein